MVYFPFERFWFLMIRSGDYLNDIDLVLTYYLYQFVKNSILSVLLNELKLCDFIVSKMNEY